MSLTKKITSFSKKANHELGDRTGRTISTRTANGFQDSIPFKVSEDTAVDIVHVIMFLPVIAVIFNNKYLKWVAVFALVILVSFYHAGKYVFARN